MKTASLGEWALPTALGAVGTLGVGLYVDYLGGSSSSNAVWLVCAIPLIWTWHMLMPPHPKDRRALIAFGIFSLLLSISLVGGRVLDLDVTVNAWKASLICFLLWFGIFPVSLFVAKAMTGMPSRTQGSEGHLLLICFGVVVLCWLCVYLAAFPGIYTTDAYSWYYEFDDFGTSISSQWSPVYAGAFYLFVHTSHELFNSYEIGLAGFSALQMAFALFVIYRVMRLSERELGSISCIAVGIFYGMIPTHAIMTLETAQGAVFAPVFTMIVLHLVRMALHPSAYWACSRNGVAFVCWCVLGCILRNNAMYALLVLLPFIALYQHGYRKRLLSCVLLGIAFSLIYSGPILTVAGVQKTTTIREMLSMPLQQMAYVYTYCPDGMTQDQRSQFVAYVTQDSIDAYASLNHTGISDDIKRNLDDEAVLSDPARFARLYLSVGAANPIVYIKAAGLQDLGLLYPDKSYPDTRIWHYYLDYESYRFDPDDITFGKYININRNSLFPALNHIFDHLFGSNPTGLGDGYVPVDSCVFSKIPLIGPLCRASVWFWTIVFIFFCGIWTRWRSRLVPVVAVLAFILTVALAPLIMYRYCAPFIFPIPALIVLLRASQEPRERGKPTPKIKQVPFITRWVSRSSSSVY